MRQFIVQNQNIKNGLIYLEGKDFRYLRQVLRVKTGDMLNVRLADGSLQGTTVASIDDKNKKIILQICESPVVNAENSVTRGVQASEVDETFNTCEYWLFQFIPKAQKFETIVRQATECGIAKIVPVIGEYSEKSSIMALQGAKSERLERIVKEARQQSGSPVNTTVLPPMNLDEAIKLWNEEKDTKNQLGFVLSERTDDCVIMNKVFEEKGKPEKVCVVCGSEGGISPEEVSLLKEKGLFAPIHFAVNILRCETAALYGIAAVQTAIFATEK